MVENEQTTRMLDARLDELIVASDRVNPDDPEWQALARRRQWMRRWLGVWSVRSVPGARRRATPMKPRALPGET